MSPVPPDLREEEAEIQKDYDLCKVGGIIGCGPQVSKEEVASEGPDSQHSALGTSLFLYPCFSSRSGVSLERPHLDQNLS